MFDNNKMNEVQNRANEIKKRLDGIITEAQVEGGKIKVKITGNKHLLSIDIEENFHKSTGREALEDLLLTAVNKALQEAEAIGQAEIQSIAKEMFGGMGN